MPNSDRRLSKSADRCAHLSCNQMWSTHFRFKPHCQLVTKGGHTPLDCSPGQTPGLQTMFGHVKWWAKGKFHGWISEWAANKKCTILCSWAVSLKSSHMMSDEHQPDLGLLLASFKMFREWNVGLYTVITHNGAGVNQWHIVILLVWGLLK